MLMIVKEQLINAAGFFLPCCVMSYMLYADDESHCGNYIKVFRD